MSEPVDSPSEARGVGPPATATSPLGRLTGTGVVGVTVVWADNNGIPRSRTVPATSFAEVVQQGVGITPLFAVFDSHDAVTYAHEALSTPSGDIRLLPVADRVTTLAGQPDFAWVPGRQVGADGGAWPYDQRTRLEEQVARAAASGIALRAGFEIELFVGHDAVELQPACDGPAYSPHALLRVDELAAQVLADLAANGVGVGQLHAEYGLSQLEVSLAASDPVSAADQQLLARQTIHAAARAHGLRVSFAPLVAVEGMGNGCHLHLSAHQNGANLLASDELDKPTGKGASFVAGLLRDLPAVAAITAPSVPSLLRRRPGHFAGAYSFWGIENREAPLRYVPNSKLLAADHANVELKASDASANPYLALAVAIAAGLAGIDDGLELDEPIQEDPGTWSEEERTRRHVHLLPTTPDAQEAALLANRRVCAVLGEPLLGAFSAARRSDAAWAAGRRAEEVVAAHRWVY